MKFLKKNLANIFTLTNLSLGFIGIIIVMYSDVFIRGGILTPRSFYVKHGSLLIGSVLIFVAALIDFADGFVARKFNIVSDFGKQLDSLADLVSFGVLPALIVHNLILRSNQNWTYFLMDVPLLSIIPVVLVIGSAIRLAKYNTMTGGQGYFKGLPTPANALFWASFPLIFKFDLYVFGYETIYLDRILSSPVILSVLCILMLILMVSNIPMFSLKLKNLKWKGNSHVYLLLICFILAFIFLRFMAIPIIILIYLILSIIFKNRFKSVV